MSLSVTYFITIFIIFVDGIECLGQALVQQQDHATLHMHLHFIRRFLLEQIISL